MVKKLSVSPLPDGGQRALYMELLVGLEKPKRRRKRSLKEEEGMSV